MICVSLRVNFVLKSTTLLLLCSYHVLKWELFILDSIILFLCFARSKFCSKIPRFSIRIALTIARTARLTLYGTFFTILPFIEIYLLRLLHRPDWQKSALKKKRREIKINIYIIYCII